MRIGTCDTESQVYIIAEIGNNHEGDIGLAEEMVGLAAEAGVDAVKFQTIVPERLVSSDQKDRLAQLKRLCLKQKDFERLASVAKKQGVHFLSTPFDLESVAFLDPLVPAFKIASGDNTFYPLLEEVARTGKPIIMSAGLSDLAEVANSQNCIRRTWKDNGIDQDLASLHCVACYPTPVEDANLWSIRALNGLGETVGYSDHTLGIDAAVLSVAAGARIVEKHFTLDKHRAGFRDHALSADPRDMAELVRRVREAELLLGREEKSISACEQAAGLALRRSISAKVDLPKGIRLEQRHFTWLRPGTGISPGRENELIGKVLLRTVNAGELILAGDIER